MASWGLHLRGHCILHGDLIRRTHGSGAGAGDTEAACVARAYDLAARRDAGCHRDGALFVESRTTGAGVARCSREIAERATRLDRLSSAVGLCRRECQAGGTAWVTGQ